MMCSKFYRRLFECLRLRAKGDKGGIRPETFLTPYEMEIVPLLIKDVLTNYPNFFEIVCYRWHNETLNNSLELSLDEDFCQKNENFEKEGQYLKSLILKLASCLAEKGTFDDDCEKRLILYRQRRQQRVFNAPLLSNMTNDDTKIYTNTITSNNTGRINENQKYKNTVLLMSEDNLMDVSIKDKRKRFSSTRSTSLIISPTSPLDLIFIQMGEVLIRQFQASVGAKEGHVDDREMKTLIWKHFVQMLIVVLTDSYRY